MAGLTELGEDGKIPNTEFSVIGVRVGVAVQYIKDDPPMRCNVVDMSDDLAITIEKVVAEEETTGKKPKPPSPDDLDQGRGDSDAQAHRRKDRNCNTPRFISESRRGFIGAVVDRYRDRQSLFAQRLQQ